MRVVAVPDGCVVHTATAGSPHQSRRHLRNAVRSHHRRRSRPGGDSRGLRQPSHHLHFRRRAPGDNRHRGRTAALARVQDHIVDRRSLLVPCWSTTRRDRTQPPLGMRGTRHSPVTRIAAGPAGTVAAGFANGEVALWNLRTGAVLLNARLHGGIIHLVAGPSGLVAASDSDNTSRGIWRRSCNHEPTSCIRSETP